MRKREMAIIAALSFAAAGTIRANHIQYSDLPPAVQKKIDTERGSGTIKSIDRRTDANGQVIYDVQLERRDTHLRLDSEGTVLKEKPGFKIDVGNGKAEVKTGEETHTFSTDKNDGKILGIVPAPGAKKKELDAQVKSDKELKAEAGADTRDHRVEADAGPHHVEVDASTDHGITARTDRTLNKDYSANIDRDHGASVKTDGTKNKKGVFGLGATHVAMDNVPNKVQETIRREADSNSVADIKEIRDKGQVCYAVKIQREGRNRKLEVAPDGTVLKDSEKKNVGRAPVTESGTGTIRP
jgi:hypothetical protein